MRFVLAGWGLYGWRRLCAMARRAQLCRQSLMKTRLWFNIFKPLLPARGKIIYTVFIYKYAFLPDTSVPYWRVVRVVNDFRLCISHVATDTVSSPDTRAVRVWKSPSGDVGWALLRRRFFITMWRIYLYRWMSMSCWICRRISSFAPEYLLWKTLWILPYFHTLFFNIPRAPFSHVLVFVCMYMCRTNNQSFMFNKCSSFKT